MAKNTLTSIVDVWNKTAPVLESGDLSAIEQITLIHTLIALNRNLWQPVKINPAIIAAATFKDKRTIASAIDKLVSEDLLTRSEKGLIQVGRHYTNQRDTATARTTTAGIQQTDTARTYERSDATVTETQPARRKRTIFNNSDI